MRSKVLTVPAFCALTKSSIDPCPRIFYSGLRLFTTSCGRRRTRPADLTGVWPATLFVGPVRVLPDRGDRRNPNWSDPATNISLDGTCHPLLFRVLQEVPQPCRGGGAVSGQRSGVRVLSPPLLDPNYRGACRGFGIQERPRAIELLTGLPVFTSDLLITDLLPVLRPRVADAPTICTAAATFEHESDQFRSG